MERHTQYYRYATGKWEGTAHLRITSFRALFDAKLLLVEKISFVMMALLERLLGPARLTTRVIPTDKPDRFEHVAEIRRAGVCIYRGQRRFALQPDGESVLVEGEEFRWPLLRRPVPLSPGTAKIVDERNARYRMSSTGQVWDVDFEIGPTQARSVLACPWGRGEERLHRGGC